MKIMRDRYAEGMVGQRIDATSLDEGSVAGILNFAMDGEEGFLGYREAPLFEELRANNGIGDAGFVLEANKDKSFGRSGALAADDHSCDVDTASISRLRQIARQSNVVKLLADESHGMASCGNPGPRKVGIQTLKGIHGS